LERSNFLPVEVDHSTGTEFRHAETLARREPEGASEASEGHSRKKPYRRSAHVGHAA
jgi:hypothetical protein